MQSPPFSYCPSSGFQPPGLPAPPGFSAASFQRASHAHSASLAEKNALLGLQHGTNSPPQNILNHNTSSSPGADITLPHHHPSFPYDPATAAAAAAAAFYPSGPSPANYAGGTYFPLPPGSASDSSFYRRADMAAAGWVRPSYNPYDNPYHPAYHTAAAYAASAPLDGGRRKNATRESTATLKAWLQEHLKNPYPTKGEKIMLAIITKMTLTQVSTWFANARRRLKKENRMTWAPKSKEDEEDGLGGDELDRDGDILMQEPQHNSSDSGCDRTLSPGSPPLKKPSSSAASAVRGDLEHRPIWSLAESAMIRSGSS